MVPWRPGLIRRNGFYLTWSHVPVFTRAARSGRYSHLVYLEDDIRFVDAHLRYWCDYRPALEDQGFIPGFVRYEVLDGVRFVTDQTVAVDPARRRIAVEPRSGVRCHEFVSLPNPHQGMYVLDMPLAAVHLRFSANRSPLRSETIAARTGFGLCERNSSGPIFDEVPSG